MPIPSNELSETLAAVVEKTGASVVRVEGRRRPSSGVVWSPTQIVTTSHTLHEDAEVTVAQGEKTFRAKVKGRDPSTDLALLEIDGGPLTPANFSEGAALKVGHVVLLLARPGETVRATAGIVSALGHKKWRTPRGGEVDRYLEADAPHQPGFSGGPLVGLDGAVFGITSTGVIRGTSLTLPTATVRRIVTQLATHGRVRQSWLGLSMQPVQLPDPVRATTGEELGLLVTGVEKGSPAEAAGITYGDTLLHLGDDTVKTLEDLYAYLRADHVGEKVPVKLFRQGAVQTIQVTLGARQ